MYRFSLIGAGSSAACTPPASPGTPTWNSRRSTTSTRTEPPTLASRHGAPAATDLGQALDPDRVDAVLIASSTDTHATHLRAAADAGLAVLCEKPIDLDLARAAETVRYVADRGFPAMVDFNRRFDRDYAELRRAVVGGEIGDIVLIQLTSRGPSMPPLSYIAVSGGQMSDQTVRPPFVSPVVRVGPEVPRTTPICQPGRPNGAGSAAYDPHLSARSSEWARKCRVRPAFVSPVVRVWLALPQGDARAVGRCPAGDAAGYDAQIDQRQRILAKSVRPGPPRSTT